MRPDERGDRLIVLQAGAGDGATCVCIPAAGATVASFLSLRHSLGPHDWLLGMEPPGTLDGDPHATVEAAAMCYLEALGDHRTGALHVLGHSFGGWIAFDMALRLQAAGTPAASLTLLDTQSPSIAAVREYTATETLMALVASYEDTAGQPLGIEPRQLEELDAEAQLALVHRHAVAAGVLPRRSTASAVRGPLRVLAAALRCKYEPNTTLDGIVNLVLAPEAGQTWEAAMRSFVATTVHWRRFAPRVRPLHVGGTHGTLLKEAHIASWAHLLSGRA
jgi:arthrofactin-type cyclic lipopeptide synthetase C